MFPIRRPRNNISLRQRLCERSCKSMPSLGQEPRNPHPEWITATVPRVSHTVIIGGDDVRLICAAATVLTIVPRAVPVVMPWRMWMLPLYVHSICAIIRWAVSKNLTPTLKDAINFTGPIRTVYKLCCSVTQSPSWEADSILVIGVRLTSHWTAAAFTGLLFVPRWGWVKRWMNEWMNERTIFFNFRKSEAHDEMILTGENRRTGRKPCPSATLSTTNPTGLTRARTLAAAVRDRRITAWAMARPKLTVTHTIKKLLAFYGIRGSLPCSMHMPV
jgi:hypothetical protein